MMRRAAFLLSLGMLAAAPACAAAELSYGLTEGNNLNAFVREGPVAAHLLLRNGSDPRILVAFPAGNSGVGLWFGRVDRPARWQLAHGPEPVALRDARGRALHGIVATLTSDAPQLGLAQAVLSNVRFLRDYQSEGRFPAAVRTAMQRDGTRLIWARDRVDGAPGYRLEVKVLSGRIDGATIRTAAGSPIRLRVTAATGETPLAGLSERELLNAHAAPDPAARRALAFLSYREKFLAGSWRFDTYFGRDTLMSVRLLMPALNGQAVEAGLGAVLARLDPGGEVAHEEGLAEFALLDRQLHGAPASAAATLDYGMVDDDYMLAPVAADYLLDHATRTAAAAFLARAVPSIAQPGTAAPAGALLVRNLRYVLEQARPFAQAPATARLIAIKPGRMTGEWRDSEEGLGRGRYPYDVNAALVPAALDAAARLLRAGLLDPYLSAADRTALDGAGAASAMWRAHAPSMFRVEMPAAEAAARIRAYAGRLRVPAEAAVRALEDAPLAFHALALDAAGAPVPILHSDEGFVLLFDRPSPTDLERDLAALMRPFPAGLMTDIGLLVANPAVADDAVQARFSPAAYHGAVVWSWQQALFAAGLERQLARTDLPAATRTLLRDAQARLWRAIEATRATRSSELWSWRFADGRYQVVPFGAGKQDADESNAAQLWSTVYLAVQPPRAPRPARRTR